MHSSKYTYEVVVASVAEVIAPYFIEGLDALRECVIMNALVSRTTPMDMMRHFISEFQEPKWQAARLGNGDGEIARAATVCVDPGV